MDVAEPLVGQLHHPHISLEKEDVVVAEHPVARALPSQLHDERLANFLQDKGVVVVLRGFDLGGEIVQEELLAFENALKASKEAGITLWYWIIRFWKDTCG